MALKVKDNSPSPFASTSFITLEEQSSTSPSKSKMYIESDPVKMRDPPCSIDEGRPSPVPSDYVKMEEEDPIPKHMEHSPISEDPLPTKSDPSASTSPSTSPKPESTPPTPRKPLKKGPQLIGHLPIAREEAMRTFVEMQENQYQYSTLGRSREALESMTCECPLNGSGEYTAFPGRWS
jgi:hypothetical protein